MNFEWDQNKNNANIKKHGIDFADCPNAWAGPHLIGYDDEYQGEIRQNLLGFVRNRLVNITFTERENAIRIISARKATKNEQKIFSQG